MNYPYYNNGVGLWILMSLAMLVFWGILAWAVVSIVRHREAHGNKAPLPPSGSGSSDPVGAEKLIQCTDQGRCTRKNVGTCRATYVPHSVAPAVRPDPDGELEILVSNPIGVFGTHREKPTTSSLTR